MTRVGKSLNADLDCQVLFDTIDSLNTTLGEHGARGHLDEFDQAKEVCEAIKAYAIAQRNVQQDPAADQQALTTAFNAIFVAAKAYYDNFAPAYGPDDEAKAWKNEGEPERVAS